MPVDIQFHAEDRPDYPGVFFATATVVLLKQLDLHSESPGQHFIQQRATAVYC